MRLFAILFIFILCSNFSWNSSKNDAEFEIDWIADKPLTWIDFQAYPDYSSKFDAISVCKIIQTINCDEYNNFECDIKTKFLCHKSWTISNKVDLLLHEQKHFDLTEVYARKIRKQYASIKNPCNYELDDLAEIYNVYLEELQVMQNQYDIETDHGIKKYEQKIWNEKIERALQNLSNYSK